MAERKQRSSSEPKEEERMSRYEAKHELKHTSKHGLNHKSKHVAKHDLKRVPRHKPTIFYVFGVTLLIIAVCGTVLAYMFKSTDDKTNHFTPAVVSCEVKEITDQQVTEKSSIKVKNTGNINAYIRVRFVSYWIRTTDDGQNQIVPMPSEMPEIDINQGWLKGENHTYYCKSPIAPGDLTNE